jgi:hypothetical protein
VAAAEALWPPVYAEASERPRARTEIATALTLFETASGAWAKQRDEAAAWLADHERTAR